MLQRSRLSELNPGVKRLRRTNATYIGTTLYDAHFVEGEQEGWLRLVGGLGG